jgi:hypothetical protein
MKTRLTFALAVIAVITAGNLQKVNAQNWLTTGNSALSSSNFLGTKDSVDLIFKASNTERGRLLKGGAWRFGTSTNFTNIDAGGKLTFGGTGAYLVAGNHYVFQYSTTPNYGLYFNSTTPQYEFRNSSASPVFYVNAGNGNGVFKGNLKIGTYTLPSTDGASGQVLKTNGAGALSWSNDNSTSYTAGTGIRISGNVISNTGDVNGADDANLSLSNLSSTAINQSLLPQNTNSIDLGSFSNRWRNGYFSGNVGIGGNASYPLDVYTENSFEAMRVINNNPGGQQAAEFYSFYDNGLLAHGGVAGLVAIGEGGGVADEAYGVIAYANNAASDHYGIYASAFNGSFNAAGYFNGDVYAANYFTASDRKLKTAINPLQNSLGQLMKLKPATFQFKTTDYPQMQLPHGEQMGLIADEVKQVFPELVKEQVQPAKYGKDLKEVLQPKVKFNGVNYVGLIPVLIASIQEQQKQIEELKQMVEKLSHSRTEVSSGSVAESAKTSVMISNAKLEQNNPNPFASSTSIRYSLPTGFRAAQIVITDNSGRTIKQVQLNTAGNGSVNIDASILTSGTYNYSLVVDGKVIENKKMIVAH